MECPECGKEEFCKNGKRKDGIQRYKCKNCKKSISEHDTFYTKAEKRLLSFLLNFLENDLGDLDIKEFLAKSKEYRPGISDIEIELCKKTRNISSKSRDTIFTAHCKKPRLIICEDDGKLP
jgi:Insertion element protein.